MRKLPENPPENPNSTFLSSIVSKYYQNEMFRELVDRNNSKYLYWDELKYRISKADERNEVWAMMKILRSSRSDPLLYSPVLLKYNLLPEIIQSLHRYDRYLSGNIQIQNRELKLEDRYIENSLIEEAIASSILEGAVTTRKAAREMLEKKKSPRNEGERMVMNSYETLQMIKKHLGRSITPEFILEIQRSVTKDTIPDEDVGLFRDNNEIKVIDPVYGTIHHIPPDFESVKPLVDDLCDFINGIHDKTFTHPIIKGIVLHFLIGYIHPFNDGNGRTARSLFYWYTMSQGYWLMEYLSISKIILETKNQYSLAYLYSEYDGMDLTYFIRYHTDCMNRALDELIKYIKSAQETQLKAQIIARSTEELTQRQAGILIELVENLNQEYTIYQIFGKFAIARESARTDLHHLEDMKLISKIKKGKTFYYYIDDENLKRIKQIGL